MKLIKFAKLTYFEYPDHHILQELHNIATPTLIR